ncbi:MAG: DUF433 domain-containing protein [Pseudomonadota bacterium]
MAEASIIRAFTEEQASRLTGVSRHQLRYWDNEGFFSPSLADKDRRVSFSRMYSFQDLASLRVLNTLKNEVGCSLQHLREVKDRLDLLSPGAWASTTLFVLNKKVVFFNPETSRREEVVSGQLVLQIPLKVVQRDMEQAISKLWERDPSSIGEIDMQRGVASSEPVIKDTRISVRALKAFSDAGYSIAQILEQYPSLTRDDVEAALRFEKVA